MFTGIIEATGTVTALTTATDSARLTISCPLLAGTAAGESVAVNGVCLTAVDPAADHFSADVMAETLRRSTLGNLRPGDPVNLERSVTLATRLGGHLVQGHVDGVATVAAVEPAPDWRLVRLSMPDGLLRYVVEKGSLALDGVSLTVAGIDGDEVTVSLIPETLSRTTWGERRVGDRINVEVDVLAKYVERLLTVGAPR